MNKSLVQVLVVDDYEAWRRVIVSTLQTLAGVQVVGEASDGLEAIQQAQELQPDLIVLDIGLPTVNGLAAARRIREVSPASKILFVSENRSAKIAETALNIGGSGYVVKSNAGSELLPAVRAVLEGKRFVSANLAGGEVSDPPNPQAGIPSGNRATGKAGHHEVGFYSVDRHFLVNVSRFIRAALEAGNSAIVIATEVHREGLLRELQACGLDMAAAIREGRYVQLDAAEALSRFMVNGKADAGRFLEGFGDLIVTAREAARGTNSRVSIFGEGVHVLWAQGNTEAAIQVEKLVNKLTQIHDVDILCGYCTSSVEGAMDAQTFQQICAEHTFAYSE